MKARSVILLGLYLLTTAFIVSLISSPGLVNERAGVIPMTDFAAHKPFQYRVLMPILVRTVEWLTPAAVEIKANYLLGQYVRGSAAEIGSELDQSKAERLSRYGYRVGLFLVLNSLALLMFLFSLRYLARALGIFSYGACDYLPLGMAAVMPIFFEYSNFMYDFSHLLLFTVGLILLHRGRWAAYLVVLALGILNKETAIFLTVIFALFYYRKLAGRQFFRLLAAQIIMFAVIQGLLHFLFRHNPGPVIETHLAWNWNHLSHLENYFRFRPVGHGMLFPVYLNIPIPAGVNLPLFLVVTAAVLYGWKNKPQFLRRATGYFAILVPLTLVFGRPPELRAFYDAVPIVYLLAVSGLMMFARDLEVRVSTRLRPPDSG